MKRNALLKELKKNGWFKSAQQKTKHEKWENGNGQWTLVGRHPDIPEPTAKSIIKKAKSFPGKK